MHLCGHIHTRVCLPMGLKAYRPSLLPLSAGPAGGGWRVCSGGFGRVGGGGQADATGCSGEAGRGTGRGGGGEGGGEREGAAERNGGSSGGGEEDARRDASSTAGYPPPPTIFLLLALVCFLPFFFFCFLGGGGGSLLLSFLLPFSPSYHLTFFFHLLFCCITMWSAPHTNWELDHIHLPRKSQHCSRFCPRVLRDRPSSSKTLNL